MFCFSNIKNRLESSRKLIWQWKRTWESWPSSNYIRRTVIKHTDWSKFQSLLCESLVFPSLHNLNFLYHYELLVRYIDNVVQDSTPPLKASYLVEYDDCTKLITKRRQAIAHLRRRSNLLNFIISKKLLLLPDIFKKIKISWRQLCSQCNYSTPISCIWKLAKLFKNRNVPSIPQPCSKQLDYFINKVAPLYIPSKKNYLIIFRFQAFQISLIFCPRLSLFKKLNIFWRR